ncbi:hypothetical protein JQC92_12415 [Shewanella sp. 202IG2-18]|uniref:hypothetical protein n=1 Tax=Parashewanella hymeniacidonis TaxID=2807618 RepID=UPI0019612473|nr:hypothetical protein [Parashewanella hymeniacidonis]MBM7072826.1 hypothetical protein [Parashewanella hymeniacidonis]
MAIIEKSKTSRKTKKVLGKFNYSLTEMKKAVNSKKSVVPKINNVNDLEAWLNA